MNKLAKRSISVLLAAFGTGIVVWMLIFAILYPEKFVVYFALAIASFMLGWFFVWLYGTINLLLWKE